MRAATEKKNLFSFFTRQQLAPETRGAGTEDSTFFRFYPRPKLFESAVQIETQPLMGGARRYRLPR